MISITNSTGKNSLAIVRIMMSSCSIGLTSLNLHEFCDINPIEHLKYLKCDDDDAGWVLSVVSMITMKMVDGDDDDIAKLNDEDIAKIDDDDNG